MVVPRTQVQEFTKHEVIKRPLSATRMMLNILESSPHEISYQHSQETRFNIHPILALSE